MPTSIYRYNQGSWLNLMALCTFFNINFWFNACFKFCLCITYSFYLSCNFARGFSTFSVLILSGEKVNDYEGHAILANFKKMFYTDIFFIAFINPSWNWGLSSTHLNPPTGNFCEHVHPHQLFTPQYLIYHNHSFIISHLFVVSFCLLMNYITYFTSNTFFYH